MHVSVGRFADGRMVGLPWARRYWCGVRGGYPGKGIEVMFGRGGDGGQRLYQRCNDFGRCRLDRDAIRVSPPVIAVRGSGQRASPTVLFRGAWGIPRRGSLWNDGAIIIRGSEHGEQAGGQQPTQ